MNNCKCKCGYAHLCGSEDTPCCELHLINNDPPRDSEEYKKRLNVLKDWLKERLNKKEKE